VALVTVAVLLVLAILKPWGAIPGFEATGSPATGAGGSYRGPAPGSGPPSPPPTADPALDLEHHCPQPSGWLVFAHEVWSGGGVRSWKSLSPARVASGPLDPTIPRVPLTSQQVPLLGYCAPWRGPDRPSSAATVRVWRLAPDGESAELLRLRAIAPRQATSLGALYAPPTAGGDGRDGPPAGRGPGASQSWPAGVYVFALLDGAFQRWWAVEVVITPARTPVPSPG
jgi:hypothetical protein